MSRSCARRRSNPRRFPRRTATTIWSAAIRLSATWCPATWRRVAAKERCDAGFGVNETGAGRVPRLLRPRSRVWASRRIRERYGNLFQMYEKITDDESLQGADAASSRPCTTRWAASGSTTTSMTTIPGLYAIGEANFSDHGANRLGASALMQGLADGYFVLAVHDRRLSLS